MAPKQSQHPSSNDPSEQQAEEACSLPAVSRESDQEGHSQRLNESEGSTSSEESSDETDTESDGQVEVSEQRINLGGPRKPNMALGDIQSSLLDMRSRLDSFLPQLMQANQNLSAKHNMETLNEDGGQHIDMEIACGVLERKVEANESLRDKIKLPSSKDQSTDTAAKGIEVVESHAQPDLIHEGRADDLVSKGSAGDDESAAD